MPGDIQHAKHQKDFVTASDFAEAASDATIPQQPAGPFIPASLSPLLLLQVGCFTAHSQ